jgi:hypothetical protein
LKVTAELQFKSQNGMMWFHWPRLGRSSRSVATVCTEEEAVSDVQLSCTCVAAVVGSGTAHILLADGSRIIVPDELVERSGVLTDLANATDLISAVLLSGRAHMHTWFQYLQLRGTERDSFSWLTLLRSLLVRSTRVRWFRLVRIVPFLRAAICARQAASTGRLITM